MILIFIFAYKLNCAEGLIQQQSDLCFSELELITLVDELSTSMRQLCFKCIGPLLTCGQLVSQTRHLSPQLIHQRSLVFCL